MENIVSYFSALEPGKIDQARGGFSSGKACCVGAHLAGLIEKSEFTFGKNALARGLCEAGHKAANAAHVHLLLRAAGIADPWGREPWKRPPAEIFAEMAKIEKLPATRRADFQFADLIWADLRNADFDAADFRGADLRHADCWRTYFRRADFRFADCWRTYFRWADLRGADFEGADLRNADFRGADCRWKNWKDANFAGALYDDETKFPAGFCPKKAKMIKK